MKRKKRFREVNRPVWRVDGLSIVTGQPIYTDDFDLPSMLHVKILRSPHAHAKIVSIDASRAEALPGVACVLTYRDLPRIAHTTAGQGAPEPSPYDAFVLDRKVRFVGDRVAAVAAEDAAIADRALKLIKVTYEVLPPVFDPRDSMKKGAPVIHDEEECRAAVPVEYRPEINLAAKIDIQLGSVEKGLERAAVVHGGEFEVHYASHSAIEPHAAVTWLDRDGRLVIVSTTQVPYHVRRIVARTLNIPLKKIRALKPRIGGGFGGKQEVFLEQLAAAFTLKTGRPVKIRLGRDEVFTSARTRHPARLTTRVGTTKSGRMTAFELKARLNTGAYGTHALTVGSNVGIRTLPLWHCDNLRLLVEAVYTNLPVAGAYRGYGGTQGIFATCLTMDELSEKLGMDPVGFYLKNIIGDNDTAPILNLLGEGPAAGSPVVGSCRLADCIKVGARLFDWERKRSRRPGKGRLRRGVGMAVMMQGSGIPHVDMCSAFIKMNEDGSFNLLVGATDIGQGSDTALAQIAAEVLTVPTGNILVRSSDTDLTPFDPGAYASKTTYLAGAAVKKTAERVRELILEVGARLLGTKRVRLEKGMVRGPGGRSVSLSRIGHLSLYERNHVQIAACESATTTLSPPPFAAHFGEVEVDTRTGKLRITDYLQVIDCGVPVNPPLARGQAIGALVCGMSYALAERYIFGPRGALLNANYGYYKIFCSRDLPPLKTVFLPAFERTGPFGAKSVGEIAINGPLPVISNALYQACGVRMRKAPFTPDRVLEAISPSRTRRG